MAKKIAVFGGSFNPPGAHHRAMVPPLVQCFDEVRIVPCGLRPDKPSTGYIIPAHRKELAHLAFADISPRVVIDDFDLENDTFTRTFELHERYKREGEIWHVMGTDLLTGGGRGESAIHTWEHGALLWESLRFAVFLREGIPFNRDDLPPMHMLFSSGSGDSSREIRERIAEGLPISGHVTQDVERYIDMHQLYRRDA